MVLYPAYGRQYADDRAVLKDFYNGRNFISRDTALGYVDITDIPDGQRLTFIYGSDKERSVLQLTYRKVKARHYRTSPSQRAQVQRYQDKLRSQGLCIRCREPHIRDKLLCHSCTKAAAQQYKDKHLWFDGVTTSKG
jgi:hypothetical protein